MSEALDNDAIQAALKELPGWDVESGKLVKRFEFDGFKEALSFIVRIGLHAEGKGHHPEIFNVYNNVTLSLATHDAGGAVTNKDVDLAKLIENINWLPQKRGS
jgi:4a-hydroxytetrahydrobiopterin dehydratase